MAPHLVQLNIATLRHPLDDPRSADFVNGLPTVNAAAEQSPGFVWRLQSDSGDATDIKVFENPLVIVNLTVWTSIEALKGFAFRGIHRDFFRRRAEWFVEGESRTAMWWTPPQSLPTTDDAKRRLDFIEAFGTSPYAFHMGQSHRVVTMRWAGDGDWGGVVADVDGEPAAFGWYRTIDSTTAVVERIDVPPAVRGMRLGAAIVAEMEAAARADGLSHLRLHTVPKQAEPYERFGFVRRRCEGGMDDWSRSVCMEKTLGRSPAV